MLEVALTHRQGDFTLSVQFEAPGGVTALFGRSGSGKTTLVNLIAGLTRAQEGRIVLEGRVLFDRAAGVSVPPHRRRLGYVFQDARLFPHLDVRGNLLYGARFAPRGAAGPELGDVAALLGIEALLDRRPAGLSGGEKSRVAIGRALLSRPRMLLMDEPLAALDMARRVEILGYLERLRDTLDLPILYVSHALTEIARLARTMVLMDGGHLCAAGPVSEVLADPALAPVLGPRDTGALVTARVIAHDDDGLSRLSALGTTLWLPRVGADPGQTLRLRIMASDLILALAPPQGLSALNVVPARVIAIRPGDGPGALVQLEAGGERILARVTGRSVKALDLRAGMTLHAILKAVSIARDNVG